MNTIKELTFSVKLMVSDANFSGGLGLEDLTVAVERGEAVCLSCVLETSRILKTAEAKATLLELSFDPDSLPFGL